MITLIMFIAAFTQPASAKDLETSWLCMEASSQRRDNNFLSCGIGTGMDEGTARTKALENAQAEFKSLCDVSTDCKGHEMSVWPARTSCAHNADGYTCHRLVQFTISEELVKVAKPPGKELSSNSGTTEIPVSQPSPVKVIESPVAKAVAQPAPVVLAAVQPTSGIECSVRCNALDQSACWLPGARWKLNHGCK